MESIIDIGSNTIRYQVYDIVDNNLKKVVDKKEFAKLADYKDELNNLTEYGINICINILNYYKEINELLGINDIHVIATASLRNISNEKEVLTLIKEKTNLDVKIITGDDEALYGYNGCKKYIDFESGITLDVGGGSSEIVLFKNDIIENTNSIPLGSLNSYNKYKTGKNPLDFDYIKLKKVILKELKKKYIDIELENIVGIGGL